MARHKSALSTAAPAPKTAAANGGEYGRLVRLDEGVAQYFESDPSETYRYAPYLAAEVSVGFHNAAKGIDLERAFFAQLDLGGLEHLDWDDLEREIDPFEGLPTKAPADALFRPLPHVVTEDKALRQSVRSIRDYLYTNERLELYRCKSPRLESHAEETLDQFTVRLQDQLEEAKEAALDKLKERYGKKEERLQTQLARAQGRVEKEQADSNSTLIDVGISVLGALFGRRSATSIGRAVNKGTRAYKERGQLSRAQERVVDVEENIHDLEIELEGKIDELAEQYGLESHPIETFTIKPKKSNIAIEHMAIVWRNA